MKLTDHKNYILCYSTPPFPVWIWTDDDIDEDTNEQIWNAMKQYHLVNTDMRFNVKYEFAEYLAFKVKEENLTSRIITNMLAYECRKPIEPYVVAEGKVYRCSIDENVVYYATKEAFDKGYIPTLYTNADYVASNKCYQKIGFEIRGSLCMVGFEKSCEWYRQLCSRLLHNFRGEPICWKG